MPWRRRGVCVRPVQAGGAGARAGGVPGQARAGGGEGAAPGDAGPAAPLSVELTPCGYGSSAGEAVRGSSPRGLWTSTRKRTILDAPLVPQR